MLTKKLLKTKLFLAIVTAFFAGHSFADMNVDIDARLGTSPDIYYPNQLFYTVSPIKMLYYGLPTNGTTGNISVAVWVYKTTWNADGTFNPSQSFTQDGKRYNPSNGYYEPTMQSLRECGSSSLDISNLQKVYQFPAEYVAKNTEFNAAWDGYTDPALTGGVKYQVRDCTFITIQDDSGKILRIYGPTNSMYATGQYNMQSHVEYTTDGKNNYSANIDVPIPTILPPVTHVYALLMSNECNIGTLTFSAVNKGSPYMVQYMNAKTPGNQQVLAYTELTNPVIDTQNPFIRHYTWKDMKWIKMDGTQTTDPIYPTSDFPYFIMTVVLETNDKTVTGINNGYIDVGPYIDMRNAKVLTGIPTITPQTSDIKITPVLGGFNIDCPDGICMTGYSVTDMTGRTLRSGTLTNSTTQHIEVPPAPKGLITIIKAWGKDLDNNGMERFNTTKTISR